MKENKEKLLILDHSNKKGIGIILLIIDLLANLFSTTKETKIIDEVKFLLVHALKGINHHKTKLELLDIEKIKEKINLGLDNIKATLQSFIKVEENDSIEDLCLKLYQKDRIGNNGIILDQAIKIYVELNKYKFIKNIEYLCNMLSNNINDGKINIKQVLTNSLNSIKNLYIKEFDNHNFYDTLDYGIIFDEFIEIFKKEFELIYPETNIEKTILNIIKHKQGILREISIILKSIDQELIQEINNIFGFIETIYKIRLFNLIKFKIKDKTVSKIVRIKKLLEQYPNISEKKQIISIGKLIDEIKTIAPQLLRYDANKNILFDVIDTFNRTNNINIDQNNNYSNICIESETKICNGIPLRIFFEGNYMGIIHLTKKQIISNNPNEQNTYKDNIDLIVYKYNNEKLLREEIINTTIIQNGEEYIKKAHLFNITMQDIETISGELVTKVSIIHNKSIKIILNKNIPLGGSEEKLVLGDQQNDYSYNNKTKKRYGIILFDSSGTFQVKIFNRIQCRSKKTTIKTVFYPKQKKIPESFKCSLFINGMRINTFVSDKSNNNKYIEIPFIISFNELLYENNKPINKEQFLQTIQGNAISKVEISNNNEYIVIYNKIGNIIVFSIKNIKRKIKEIFEINSNENSSTSNDEIPTIQEVKDISNILFEQNNEYGILNYSMLIKYCKYFILNTKIKLGNDLTGTCHCFNKDDTLLIIGNDLGEIIIINLKTKIIIDTKIPFNNKGKKDGIKSIKYISNTNYLVIIGNKGNIAILNGNNNYETIYLNKFNNHNIVDIQIDNKGNIVLLLSNGYIVTLEPGKSLLNEENYFNAIRHSNGDISIGKKTYYTNIKIEYIGFVPNSNKLVVYGKNGGIGKTIVIDYIQGYEESFEHLIDNDKIISCKIENNNLILILPNDRIKSFELANCTFYNEHQAIWKKNGIIKLKNKLTDKIIYEKDFKISIEYIKFVGLNNRLLIYGKTGYYNKIIYVDEQGNKIEEFEIDLENNEIETINIVNKQDIELFLSNRESILLETKKAGTIDDLPIIIDSQPINNGKQAETENIFIEFIGIIDKLNIHDDIDNFINIFLDNKQYIITIKKIIEKYNIKNINEFKNTTKKIHKINKNIYNKIINFLKIFSIDIKQNDSFEKIINLTILVKPEFENMLINYSMIVRLGNTETQFLKKIIGIVDLTNKDSILVYIKELDDTAKEQIKSIIHKLGFKKISELFSRLRKAKSILSI